MSSRDERGLAAPVVLGLTAVLGFVTLLGAVGGRVLVEGRRASAAADLGALAGAAAVQQGRPGCPAADGTVTANGARLALCRQAGEDVHVVVAIPVRVAGRTFEVRARAHAGPVSGPGLAPGG